MELEMWHLFVISNVILLASLIFHVIYYDTKDYRNLYSCLFVLVSIGLVAGTFIASVLYANMESNIIQNSLNSGRIGTALIGGIFYFMCMVIPLAISIPDKEDFEEIMKKYKLDKKVKLVK